MQHIADTKKEHRRPAVGKDEMTNVVAENYQRFDAECKGFYETNCYRVELILLSALL